MNVTIIEYSDSPAVLVIFLAIVAYTQGLF